MPPNRDNKINQYHLTGPIGRMARKQARIPIARKASSMKEEASKFWATLTLPLQNVSLSELL